MSDQALAEIVRDEAGRIVASLARSFGSLDIAEEAVSSAIEEAVRAWRVNGLPPRPGAWLATAARNDALDRVRREHRYRDKLAELLAEPSPVEDAGPDERIPLLFGCCHPALALEAQLALSLRAVVGLTTRQIARATLESEATVAQRISRAKRKIVASGIPLRIPESAEMPDRLDIVLTMVSVMYDAAHLRADQDAGADRDLADDALWLTHVITHALPQEAEAAGLRSLLLFHRARERARAVDGELVPLPEQDRTRWDRALMERARADLERAAAMRRPGRWQLQAAIAACHADAPTPADTDWRQILLLYDLLGAFDGSPLVRLNRAVALGEVAGPAVALAELNGLAPRLAEYHLWHAVRADMLRRVGRLEEAAEADSAALARTTNDAERRLLIRRLATGG